MGLDIVELFCKVEDAFRIHIENEEAEAAVTVGRLHALVLDKLQAQDLKRCLTSAAFYRTRQGIIDALGVDRRAVRPSTPLDDLLPRNTRRAKWRRIQATMTLSLPDLQHSGWIQLDLLFIGVVLAFAAGVYGRLSYGWFILLFFLGLIIGGVLIKLSPALAVVFPNNDATVGDLSRDVLAANHALLVTEVGGWNKKDVWETLCRVIMEQIGVKREDITPEASFVDDLRMN